MKKCSPSAWWGYAALWLLLVLLIIPYFKDPKHFGILDYANLVIHEAGHYMVFAWFGEFIMVLGGTLFELMVPLGFTIYFLAFRRELMAGLATAFWFFENLLYIAVYMADARFMLLPLVGDPDAHDWNYLFGKMHLLHQSVEIAGVVRGIGIMGALLTLGLMFFLLLANNPFSPQQLSTEARVTELPEPQVSSFFPEVDQKMAEKAKSPFEV